MKKKLLYAALVLVLLVGGGIGFVSYQLEQPVTAPLPPIKANTSPEAVARGAVIFHSMCEGCHRSPGSERVTGARMFEVPAFLGTFYSANITMDPNVGIGTLTDEQIARIIRYGVNRKDRMTMMAQSAMSDDDIAAVLGFMRSGDPVFQPDPATQPPTQLSTAGKLIVYLAGGTKVPDRPASGILTPPRTDKLAYGRYLAHDVFDCAGCHSPGFDASKGEGPEAFSGGFEFEDASGAKIVGPNITFHPTGIGKWSVEDFGVAIRDGLKPGGSGILRMPMPRFRGLQDDEVEALYEYLKSKPQLATKAG